MTVGFKFQEGIWEPLLGDVPAGKERERGFENLYMGSIMMR